MLVLSPFLFFRGKPAEAATFTVNSTGDAVDANVGNGVCETGPGNGVCTLRAAIQEANALSGADTINLPAGTYTLNRGSGDDTATGGDLDINGDLAITGVGARVTRIDGNSLDRVFDVRSGTVAISNLEIRNGTVGGNDGGGIRNLTALTLTDVSVSNNRAKNGGGIVNDGTITLTRVAVAGNAATSGTGGGFQSSGASPRNYLTNVTISGNSATGDGGGAEFDHGDLVNVTIANNTSPTSGGLNKRGSQSFTLKNTIIAGNTGSTQCAGSPSSLGYNLSSDGSCSLAGPGDLPNTNPLLGPLADNGGPTQTHALLAGSPAIDKGTGTGAPATDQRGYPRPVGVAVDIGAYEYGSAFVYQPDAMIKLSSEADAAYLTNDLYEAAASAQAKSLGVISGSTATYDIRFQNDGNVSDRFVIRGTGSGSGFTVQYLDNTSTDRTAAVTGAGYTFGPLAAGAVTVWTVAVTPSGNPTPVQGGISYEVFATATSATDGAKKDQVKAVTSSTSANLTLNKSADKGTTAPGEDITYAVNALNGSGLTLANNVFVTDPIPANTGFKVGGATFNAGTSTLSFTVVYSNDGGSTWTYIPTGGGCGARAGYDDCVTDVKWTTTGSMPPGTSFSVRLVVRVK